jgi:hypothetical protein
LDGGVLCTLKCRARGQCSWQRELSDCCFVWHEMDSSVGSVTLKGQREWLTSRPHPLRNISPPARAGDMWPMKLI